MKIPLRPTMGIGHLWGDKKIIYENLFLAYYEFLLLAGVDRNFSLKFSLSSLYSDWSEKWEWKFWWKLYLNLLYGLLTLIRVKRKVDKFFYKNSLWTHFAGASSSSPIIIVHSTKELYKRHCPSSFTQYCWIGLSSNVQDFPLLLPVGVRAVSQS